jgi:thiol-disulfide isomerase/thioredoxin
MKVYKMASIYEVLSERLKPNYSKIVIFIILGIFVWAAYYAYNTWKAPKADKMYAEIHQPTGDTTSTVYFFFADWCPHCKKAKPEWSKFVASHDGKTVNGRKVRCIDVDCTNSDLPETTQMISKFGIETYPTVKLMKDNQFFEFDAKITDKNLEEFVKMI